MRHGGLLFVPVVAVAACRPHAPSLDGEPAAPRGRAPVTLAGAASYGAPSAPKGRLPATFAGVAPDGGVTVIDPHHDLVFYELRDHELRERARWTTAQLGSRARQAASFAYSEDGAQLAVVIAENTVAIVDVATSHVERQLVTPDRDRDIYRLSDHGIAWQGNLLAAGAGNGGVMVWRLDRPWIAERPDEATPMVSMVTARSSSLLPGPVAFSIDRTHLTFGTNTASADYPHPCLGWVPLPPRSLAGEEELAAPMECDVSAITTWPGGTVWAGSFSGPRPATLAIVAAGAQLATLRLIALMGADHRELFRVTALAVTPDGAHAFVGDDSGRITMHELPGGGFERELSPSASHEGEHIIALALAAHDLIVHRSRAHDPVVELLPR